MNVNILLVSNMITIAIKRQQITTSILLQNNISSKFSIYNLSD